MIVARLGLVSARSAWLPSPCVFVGEYTSPTNKTIKFKMIGRARVNCGDAQCIYFIGSRCDLRISKPLRILDTGSGIRDPGSWIQDPGSKIQDPRVRIQDPWIMEPGSWIL